MPALRRAPEPPRDEEMAEGPAPLTLTLRCRGGPADDAGDRMRWPSWSPNRIICSSKCWLRARTSTRRPATCCVGWRSVLQKAASKQQRPLPHLLNSRSSCSALRARCIGIVVFLLACARAAAREPPAGAGRCRGKQGVPTGCCVGRQRHACGPHARKAAHRLLMTSASWTARGAARSTLLTGAHAHVRGYTDECGPHLPLASPPKHTPRRTHLTLPSA